ncbi:MAG: cobalamin-binding protein [Candidatus Eisenbacteria bacterium]|nr:cobalamin-binding protein [Candidatus Eisenbacteria bacterium]
MPQGDAVEILEKIAAQLQQGEEEEVAALTQRAIDAQIEPKQILDQGLIGGMNVVGELFRDHEIFLPEVLLAAKAMHAGLDRLKPLLEAADVPSRGKVILGTVQGDLHDIGKNLVGIMLRGAGFEVIDLGNDVSPERFVQAAKENDAAVIGMSALLTTTMPVMKQVITLLTEAGLGSRVRTIIGGAPVSGDFAQQIGADAYAYDGANAVEQIKALTV